MSLSFPLDLSMQIVSHDHLSVGEKRKLDISPSEDQGSHPKKPKQINPDVLSPPLNKINWPRYYDWVFRLNVKSTSSFIKTLERGLIQENGKKFSGNFDIADEHFFCSEDKTRFFHFTKLTIANTEFGKVQYVIDLFEGSLKILKSVETNSETKKIQGYLKNECIVLNELNPEGEIPGIQVPPSVFTSYLEGGLNRIGYVADYYERNYLNVIRSRKTSLIPLIVKIDECAQLLFGLSYLTLANFIHKDIKPANILVQNVQGRDSLFQISDWAGAAKVNPDLPASELISRICYGPTTAGYFPPTELSELQKLLTQAQKLEKELANVKEITIVDEKKEELHTLKKKAIEQAHKVDVYAMGVTLFEGFFGQSPFPIYKMPNKTLVSFKTLEGPADLKKLFKQMLNAEWNARLSARKAFLKLGEVIQVTPLLQDYLPKWHELNQLLIH